MKRFGPGRVRRRLAEMLAIKLYNDGYKVSFNPEKLWPAKGYWRTNIQADVYRWEGQFELYRFDKWQTISIASWSPMSDCIRGFEYEWETSYSVEVSAKEERTHPSLIRARARLNA